MAVPPCRLMLRSRKETHPELSWSSAARRRFPYRRDDRPAAGRDLPSAVSPRALPTSAQWSVTISGSRETGCSAHPETSVPPSGIQLANVISCPEPALSIGPSAGLDGSGRRPGGWCRRRQRQAAPLVGFLASQRQARRTHRRIRGIPTAGRPQYVRSRPGDRSTGWAPRDLGSVRPRPENARGSPSVEDEAASLASERRRTGGFTVRLGRWDAGQEPADL